MVKRSLEASTIGIQISKKAFALKGWTQDNLAFEVGIKTRQPIWRFFTGKAVDRHVFMEICLILELEWREIALNPPADFGTNDYEREYIGIDSLVKKVRSLRYDKIQHQCGTISLLNLNRSISISDIYIDVYILERIPSKQWQEISNFQDIDPDHFERFGMGDIAQNKISGIAAVEKYPRLRVLGKPGIGKTTFLKHLTIECNLGTFALQKVPIFISLQSFAQDSRIQKEYSLLKYITAEFTSSGISDPSIVETLLQEGRVLLLMDGLDEVLDRDATALLKEIRRFSDIYYKNQFVTSCRTASKKLSLQGYTDIEIAPFANDQITIFAQKWFTAFDKPKEAKLKASEFISKLQEPINWKFQRMVNTPLFLHLACWVYDEKDEFPANRSDFYKQGIDLLLGGWDESRGVERDEIYRGFLLPQKLKLFSQLAAETFAEGKYFFPQLELENYIGDYLTQLPSASIETEEIKYDSESILMAIESQHGLILERSQGIFSFSCLAFHEYFTSRKIVANYNLLAYGKSLEDLVSHLFEPRWREIFLLTTTMLRSADGLMQLMKVQIDNFVNQDSYLQEFLTWASQKSSAVPLQPKVATVRAFYLALSRTPHITSQFSLASSLDQGIIFDTTLDDLMNLCKGNEDVSHAYSCGIALDEILVSVLDAGLHKSLEKLYNQFPQHSSSSQRERFRLWWEDHYKGWVNELKLAIATHRNINHEWEFSLEQQQTLQCYYDANQLLLDCLRSNSQVTASVRTEIEANLLLPQLELEAKEWR